MPTIAVDFETFYRNKGEPSVDAGHYNYTHHPEFDVLMISVSDGAESWAGELKDFDWASLEGSRLVSHNAGFDRSVYRRLVEQGLAPAGLERDWQCSANMSVWGSGHRSLAKAYHYWFGEETDKSARDAFSGMTVSDIKAAGLWEATLKYAEEDAIKCLRLWEHVSPTWPAREMALSDLTIRQCARGIHVDQERLRIGIAAVKDAVHRCQLALPWFPEFPPTSPKGISEECHKHGIPCPPIKSTEGEEAFDEWEFEYSDQFEWVKRITDFRSLTKVLAGLENVRDRVRPDGRFDFSMLYYGAHTGRWSGAGGFNVQNMRKFPLTLDKRTGRVLPESEAKNLRAHNRLDGYESVDVRGMFCPALGKEMHSVDYSQIEPRVLAWVAGNMDLLQLAEQGVSVYEAYARAKGVWSGEERLKDCDVKLYTAIKAKVLQLGYQSGAKTYRIKCAEDGIDYSEEEAQQHVAEYREENPEVVALWRHLDTQFKTCMGRDFEMEGPDGSILRYENVRQTLQSIKTNKETGKIDKRWVTSAQVGYRRMAFYGGKLTENLVQHIARNVLAEGMLRVEQAGIPVLWSIHDEILTETTQGSVTPEELREIFKIRPDWFQDCPLDAEAERIDRYKK